MKCSKCGYVGFESADRCRNCGYEFALTPSIGLPDLPMRQDPVAVAGLDDLALIDAGTARRASSGFDAECGRASGEARPAPMSVRAPSLSTRSAASDLPLFGSPADDDTPLITRASPPRSPLSVRRSTPEVPGLRSVGPRAAADLALDLDPPEAAHRVVPSERAQEADWSTSDQREDAGPLRRLAALAIDGLILSAIDIAVIYLTMQICGIGVDEFGLMPKGPLVAFLVAQNVGYLIAFTASGQTLGKMTAGIEVVPSDPYESLDLGRALRRTVAWLVLACPVGLGLLSVLLSVDHRGLHDRFAGTRVVRV